MTWHRSKPAGRRRRSPGLHQGNSRALSQCRAFPRTEPRLPASLHAHPDRRAQPHRHRSLSAIYRGSPCRSRAHQCSLPGRPLEAHRPARNITRMRRSLVSTRRPPCVMVTSLHDGMNLVAKEFVAARDDDRGVLILSTFAGAAHELPRRPARQSLRCPAGCRSHPRALEMTSEEQAERMRHMRHNVREHNVYRWAANLLSDLTEIRVDAPDRIEPTAPAPAPPAAAAAAK